MGEEVERTEGDQEAVEREAVEQEAPAPGAGKPRRGSKWLRGCGLGCGAFLVLILLVGVLLVFLAFRKMDRAQDGMVQSLSENYPEWKAAGIYPKEHQAMFDELAALAMAEDSNPRKTALGFFAVGLPARDGKIDDMEVDYAVLVYDFLKNHPECTLSEVGQFYYVNPVLQERVVVLTNEFAAGKQAGEAEK
jgi:hypothetical protein